MMEDSRSTWTMWYIFGSVGTSIVTPWHRRSVALDLLLNIVERLISLVRQYDRYPERAFYHAKEV